MVRLAKLLDYSTKSSTRPLRVRLQALILFAALPGAVSILYFGINTFHLEVERRSEETRRITSQLVATQQSLIDDTNSFLKKLSLAEALQDPTSPTCGIFLSQVLQLSDRYLNLAAPKWDGELICTALPLEQNVNLANHPLFRQAVDRNVFSVDGFLTDPMTGKTSITFAYPIVPEGQKDPIGAVFAVLEDSWWSTHLMREELPEGAVATITDRAGTIIDIHPAKPDAVGKSLSEIGLNWGMDQQNVSGIVRDTDQVRRVVSQEVLFETAEGQPIRVSLGWPVDSALREARNTVLLRLSILFAFVCLCSAWALRLLKNQVLGPLGALNRTIQGFETGQIQDASLAQQTAKITDFETISGSFRRLSRARQTAEELETERRQQMQALLDALPDTYFRLSEDSIILDYRAADQNDLAMSPEQFLGRRVSEVLPKPALELFEQHMEEFQRSKTPVTWEYEMMIRGRRTDFEARLRAIPSRPESILVVRNISEVKRAREKILLQARTDFLTRLPNRACLTSETESAVHEAMFTGQSLVLMFIDLDGLKKINDKLGHATGDGLLKLVAQRLRSSVLDNDFVARHAGDEFVILLRGPAAEERTDPIARRLLASMQRPFTIGQDTVQVSASIGVASCPKDASTPQALLSAADQAMYAAKAEGGGRIRHFTSKIGDRNAYRLRLLDDMHQALQNDEFELYYQPIIDLRSGAVVMAEALLRWNHPDFGLMTPDKFLPHAEEAGLMVPLGDLALRHACRELHDLSAKFGPGFKVCVNHSPSELSARETSPGLDWARYISEHAPKDASLVVEITEASLLDPTPFTLSTLRSFKEAEIEVALDDFGAGYSSLRYFLNNQFDYLKIDREFALHAPESARASGLCDTILGLSQRLGSQAIAEGIERAEQLRFFQQRGCQLGQGFLFSKAVSKRDFLRLPKTLDVTIPYNGPVRRQSKVSST